jgi:hypothetical protein
MGNISEAEKTESCKRFQEVEVVQFSLFETILVPIYHVEFNTSDLTSRVPEEMSSDFG